MFLSALSRPLGRWRASLSLSVLLTGVTAALSPANAVSVLTQHNDVGRSGANLQETQLTPANVNINQFGELFSCNADGDIYAQPLYVPALKINGATHNVVYIATMHNSVYAYDADNGALLWQQSFGPSIPIGDVQYVSDIDKELGILGTPVIDPATNYMYFVAGNKDADNSYHNRLHVINILTGLDIMTPMDIQAQVPGTGDDAFTDTNGKSWVPFDAMRANQRPALLLLPDPRGGSSNSTVKAKYQNTKIVYIAWASHNDIRPYHGWLMGYEIDPVSGQLTQTGVYNSTPNGYEGGIWQSGQGPAADSAGNLYIMTGNGTSNINTTGGTEMSENFVKLTPSPVDASLSVADWFMPYNFDSLNGADADLGSAGVLLIPGTNYIIGGGKQSVFYVLDENNLGGYTAGSDNVHQEFQAGVQHIHGSPVYYNSPVGGPLVYVWSEYDYGHAYHFNAATGFFDTTPFSTTQEKVADGMPGAMLSISANGSVNNTAILWTNEPYSGNANNAVVPGIMRVYDAQDLSHELWDSHQFPGDDYGNVSKFTSPTVANGKVYVATFSGHMAVYGLLPPPVSVPIAPVLQSALSGDATVSITWSSVRGGRTYRLYRSTSPGGEGGTPIATNLSGNYYTDTGLTDGTTYYYKISAVNLKGESALSNEQSATPTSAPVGNGTGLFGRYYNGQTVAAPDILEEVDPTLNFNWNGASPGGTVPGTNWSARWTGYILPQYTEPYTIYATADDGVRVWVNGQQLINGWVDQGPTTYSGTISLTAGVKTVITVDYYQDGGGSECVLGWSSRRTPRQTIPQTQLFPITPGVAKTTSPTGLLGQYFSNMTLAAPETVDQVDQTVNFNWNGASPVSGVPTTQWSSRWSGMVVTPQTDNYTFYVTADDGVRLWVNGVKLVDAWVDQGPTEYSGTLPLIANHAYPIVVEYYQNGGGSECTLSWSSGYLPKQIIPNNQLTPLPVPPMSLFATPGTKQVQLRWTACTPYVSSYNVYRSTASGRETTTPYMTGITGTSAVDTQAATGVTYYYLVKGVNPAGVTSPTNEASATPQ